MTDRARHFLSVLSSAAVIGMVVVCVLSNFTDLSLAEANPDIAGSICFRYFTYDSNILAAAASLLLLVSGLSGGRFPRLAILWKYAGTCAVTVTLLTVLVYLGPLVGYDFLLSGTGLFLHAIVPLLCIVSLLCWDRGGRLSGRELLLGILPAVLYAAVYLTLVVLIPV